jgi:cyclase
MKKLLEAGADKVSINSPALENPDLINQAAREFGSQFIVVGIDSKPVDGDNWVFLYTGDKTKTQKGKIPTREWIQEVIQRGAGEIVLNSMSQDGVKQGYDIDLLQEVQEVCEVPLIASGGAGNSQHFANVFQQTQADGALAASVFHYRHIAIPELKEFLREEEVPVRK